MPSSEASPFMVMPMIKENIGAVPPNTSMKDVVQNMPPAVSSAAPPSMAALQVHVLQSNGVDVHATAPSMSATGAQLHSFISNVLNSADLTSGAPMVYEARQGSIIASVLLRPADPSRFKDWFRGVDMVIERLRTQAGYIYSNGLVIDPAHLTLATVDAREHMRIRQIFATTLKRWHDHCCERVLDGLLDVLPSEDLALADAHMFMPPTPSHHMPATCSS